MLWRQPCEYAFIKIKEHNTSVPPPPLSLCYIQDSLPAAKRHHSLVEGTDYEECDQVEEEDATLFVITCNGDISQKVKD